MEIKMKTVFAVALVGLCVPFALIQSRRGVSESRVDGQMDSELAVDVQGAGGRNKKVPKTQNVVNARGMTQPVSQSAPTSNSAPTGQDVSESHSKTSDVVDTSGKHLHHQRRRHEMTQLASALEVNAGGAVTGRSGKVCAFYLWLPVKPSASVSAHDLSAQMWEKFPNLFQVGDYNEPWTDSLVYEANKAVKMNNRLFFYKAAHSYVWANIGIEWFSGNKDHDEVQQWEWFAVPYYSQPEEGCLENQKESVLEAGMKGIATELYDFCVKENDDKVCSPLKEVCDSIDTSEKMGGGNFVQMVSYLSGFVGKCQGKAIELE